jgi:hypothetical protein
VLAGTVGIWGALKVGATKALKPGAAGVLGTRVEVQGPTLKPEAAGPAMTMGPGILGAAMGVVVKVGILIAGMLIKLLVFSTPRRVKVAGFCCSIQYKRKTRKIGV